MGIVVLFLTSLFLGVGVGRYYIQKEEPIPPLVLAEYTEIPTETPTPTLTPTPTKKPTPTPKPTLAPTVVPTPTPTLEPINSPVWMETFFVESANKYHVDVNLLKKIAQCESHFNQGVVNPNAIYAGMFQFNVSTWIANRDRMGKDHNPDLRFGAQESIETAAYVISTQGPGAWPACSR